MSEFNGKSDREILIEIAGNIGAITVLVNKHDRSLYGNGIPGVCSRLQTIEESHANCMKKHEKEEEKKERTDEFKTQQIIIDGIGTAKERRNRMYAFAGSVLGSVSLVEVAKWLYAFLTMNPKK